MSLVMLLLNGDDNLEGNMYTSMHIDGRSTSQALVIRKTAGHHLQHFCYSADPLRSVSCDFTNPYICGYNQAAWDADSRWLQTTRQDDTGGASGE